MGKHGLFIQRDDLIEIVKKHSISKSFYFGQTVEIINSINTQNIGKGQILYIGLTEIDNFNNIFYGIKLENILDKKSLDQIKKNDHIHILKSKQYKYFDADVKHSIFVRQNQIRSITKSKRQKHKNIEVETVNFMRSKSTPPPRKKTKIKKMKKRNLSPSNIQNDDDEKEEKPKKKKSKNKLHANKKMREMRRRTAPKSDLAAI